MNVTQSLLDLKRRQPQPAPLNRPTTDTHTGSAIPPGMAEPVVYVDDQRD